MPIIASHHRNDPWRPSKAWPDDCGVQWGGSGIVLGKAPYRTAFFEVFPGPGGFIRGEGKTVDEAEAQAFETFERESACTHQWGRRGYTNGGAKCIRCGAFSVKFKSIEPLGQWRAPLNDRDLSSIASGFILPHPDDEPRARKWRRTLHLKGRQAGIPLPQDLSSITDRDGFEDHCHEIVVSWLVSIMKDGREIPNASSSLIEGLLAGMHIRSLVREAQERIAPPEMAQPTA